jgi:uncharacterized protein (DUF433 family)
MNAEQGAQLGLITSNPSVLAEKPVVSGTQITVELILEKLAAGESVDQLLEAHPRSTRDGVKAALAFAAEARLSAALQAASLLRAGYPKR